MVKSIQWLRAFTSFAEDPVLFPATTADSPDSSSGELLLLLNSAGTRHACGAGKALMHVK